MKYKSTKLFIQSHFREQTLLHLDERLLYYLKYRILRYDRTFAEGGSTSTFKKQVKWGFLKQLS